MEETPKNELVPRAMGYERESWEVMKEQIRMGMASGLLPKHITRPEQAAIIALKGKELGIPLLQSLSSIAVINGKPVLSAELMLGLIYRRVPGAKIVFKTPAEDSDKRCEIEATRPGEPAQTFVFTYEEAQKAGITNNPTWTKYRPAMLRARCISIMARAKFPDAIQGCYTHEEMGGAPSEEDIVVVPAQVVSKPDGGVSGIVSGIVEKKDLNAALERFSKAAKAEKNEGS